MNKIKIIASLLALASTGLAAQIETDQIESARLEKQFQLALTTKSHLSDAWGSSNMPYVPSKQDFQNHEKFIKKWKNRFNMVSNKSESGKKSEEESTSKSDMEFILDQHRLLSLTGKKFSSDESENFGAICTFFQTKHMVDGQNYNPKAFSKTISSLTEMLDKNPSSPFSIQGHDRFNSLLTKSLGICEEKARVYSTILKYLADTLQNPIKSEINTLLLQEIDKLAETSQLHKTNAEKLKSLVNFDRVKMIKKYQRKFEKWSTRKVYLTR